MDIFTKNCKFVGIGQTFDTGRAGSGSTRQPVREQAAATSAAGAEDVVATLDPPGGDADAPTCFVVMPFTERSDDHAPGFFDEVFEELFRPAAERAGFRVKTARREGSDIIHSTIVNELLDADLVLCDLTEHNPNVLFELGLRMMEGRPVAVVRATGTQAIFDVNAVRFVEYDSNLWPSSVRVDIPKLEAHIRATWDGRETARSYISLLRNQPGNS